MNKSESKYFNTALLMDEALIQLLEVKPASCKRRTAETNSGVAWTQ